MFGSPLAATGALSRDEGGFTLVEVLVATVLALLVIGGGVAVFTESIRSQPKVASRTARIQEARTVMENLVRELRQATSVSSPTAQGLTMVTWVNSATCGGSFSATARQCRVSYLCTAGTCQRTETSVDGNGAGSTEQVVKGLSNSAVFSYATSCQPPNSTGEDSISVSDGAALRNASTATTYVCASLTFPGKT